MIFFTNPQITLGPLVLNTSLLYILIGIIAGSISLFFVSRKDKVSGKFTSDIITNFFLIVILTWKLLPVILAPVDVITNPISILYASGGTRGIGLGIGFGIIYLGLKLFFYWKYPVEANGRSPLRDILKPLIVFLVVSGLVSSSLFLVSRMLREGNVDEINRTTTVGKLAPDFELMDIMGNTVSLKNYREKWVILNFWATWCPPCRAELPTLNRFYKAMNKDRIVLLGINATGTERSTEGKDTADYVSAFAKDEGINFPVLLDRCNNTEPCVSKIYGAVNLPTTVVISPLGIITKIKTGVVDSFWLKSVTSGN